MEGLENILVEGKGKILQITLNRPDALNAINAKTWVEMGQILADFNESNHYIVAIITGAGDRAFCAGADLKAIARGESIIPTGPEKDWGFAGIVQHYTNKPIIAAVNGFALGGGTEIALACDIVIASEKATFGLPEVKRGIIAGAGGLLRLPRQIPLKIAMEHILTGEAITVNTAEKWGLINYVVPHEELLEKAIEIAEKISNNAPIALKASKDIVYKGLDTPLTNSMEAWEINESYVQVVMKSEDSIEGPTAFANKREPIWKGK